MSWLILILPIAFYYLGSRAMITHWLWSRYPAPIARFMDCPACTGFWYGAILACVFGYFRAVAILNLDPNTFETWFSTGLITLITTPIGAAILQRSLDVNGSATSDE